MNELGDAIDGFVGGVGFGVGGDGEFGGVFEGLGVGGADEEKLVDLVCVRDEVSEGLAVGGCGVVAEFEHVAEYDRARAGVL